MNRIEGKIAAFITKQQIVINRGKKHGVKDGMIFEIKLPIPDIIDPDDPTSMLSGLYMKKGTIKISSVFEKMASAVLQPGTNILVTQLSKLSVYPEQESSLLISENDWLIRVGDSVIQAKEEEEVEENAEET